MFLVKPSFTIMSLPSSAGAVYRRIELVGRTCYKSEERITDGSAEQFVRMLLERSHESVIEHESATVKFICDRGVSHELVRHRIASYSQESTRYCSYKGGVTFVIPPWVQIEPGEYYKPNTSQPLPYASQQWYEAMLNAEAWYKHLLGAKWTPQQARSVLPNSLKTEIVVTANMREWRHIFRLRCSNAAHPQMRESMMPVYQQFCRELPALFDDLKIKD